MIEPNFAVELIGKLSGIWLEWMWGMAWQLTLLVALLSVLTWVLRRKSAVLLHALWLLVLVRLVFPPEVAFPTGWAWWLRSPQPAASAAPHGLPPPPTRETDSPARRPDLPALSPETAALPAPPTDAELATTARPAASRHQRPGSEPGEQLPLSGAEASWASWLMLCWFGVSASLLGFLLVGSWRVQGWVARAHPIDDPEVWKLLDDCRELLRMEQAVDLRNSAACTTPVVVGWFQPVILLPETLMKDLDREELRAVLLHELNHIVRHDALVNFVQGVLSAVYFFHPLVWWANVRMRELREEACDELTVAALDGRRRVYGEALLKVAQTFGYAAPSLAVGVMESRSPAQRRLRRILDPHLPQQPHLDWPAILFLFVLGAVVLPGGSRSVPGNDGPVLVPNSSRRMTSSVPIEERRAAHDTSGQQTAALADPPAPTQDAASGSKPKESEAPLLRYGWESGRNYAYAVRIEADQGDTIEILSGTPTFTVRSGSDESTTLAFHGRLMPVSQPKPGRPFPLGPPRFSPFSSLGGVRFPMFPEEHVLTVNSRGSIQRIQGESQLPFLLGNLSQLVLVPLPEKPQRRWKESRTVALSLIEDRFPGGRFRPRFPGSPFERQDAAQLQAEERTEYRIVEESAETITLEKTSRLRTSQEVAGRPRTEMAGKGRIAFDRKLGLVRSLEFESTLEQNEENTTHRTPVKVTAQLLDEAELAKLREQQRQQQQAAAERKPLPEEELDKLLSDLRSGDGHRVRLAAARLERAEPQARREEVAAALQSVLTSGEAFTRQAAARALAVWCTPECVPALIDALDDTAFPVRWSAMDALVALKDSRAAAPLAAWLPKDRPKASQALKDLGPVAEDAVAPYLTHQDWSLRQEACQILKVIGTEKSLAAIEQLSREDENPLVRRAAEEARKAILTRPAIAE